MAFRDIIAIFAHCSQIPAKPKETAGMNLTGGEAFPDTLSGPCPQVPRCLSCPILPRVPVLSHLLPNVCPHSPWTMCIQLVSVGWTGHACWCRIQHLDLNSAGFLSVRPPLCLGPGPFLCWVSSNKTSVILHACLS